jgi:aminopeptidase N
MMIQIRYGGSALLALIGLILSYSSGAQPGDAKAISERLPTSVVPTHYSLALHPNADKLIFTAQLTVDLDVVTAVSAFVLNSKGLLFDSVALDMQTEADVTLDDKLQQATLHFPSAVSRGPHQLTIMYHGTITRGTLGFFAMDYESASGKRRTLATNFEPASARTLLPCWDEPAFKATYQVTVDAPSDRMAISNMPIESESPLPDGMKRVSFAQTPKMSTYLLFLGIGDYERISESVDGVQVGVVVAKGAADRGRYALHEAVRLLHYYNGYFGIRYPLPKLDLVAAPGEIQGGSMENWGAILYSQKHILFDDKDSTEQDRQLVFLVVSHEMAHQWFGDLVTMRWWDNLWLNEGFARWMQTKAADDLNPEWHTGLRAAAIIEQGMRADAKPSSHAVETPVATVAEAQLAGDNITYDKGAAVIGMLENYVGAARFRDGVRGYMRVHAFGNTQSADLWRALQSTAGKPVDGIAEDFTRRAGLPLVTVDEGPSAAQTRRAVLTQTRFFEAHVRGTIEPQRTVWRLPLAYQTSAGAKGKTLLSGEHGAIPFSGKGSLVVNAGHQSYTRVRYSPALFTALQANFGGLAAADQTAMLQDAWALGQSQYAPMSNLLALVDALPLNADPLVWRSAVSILKSLDTLYAELPGRLAFRAWALSRLNPLGVKVGWDGVPRESSAVSILREPLLETLARFGDERVMAEARRRDDGADVNPSSQPAAVRRIAHNIVAQRADSATFDRLLSRLRATRDPLDKLNQLEALTNVANPKLAARLLDVAVGSDVPAGSAPALIAAIAGEHGELTWRFVLDHIDAPDFPVDREVRMAFVPFTLSSSTDMQRARDLQAYAKDHLPAAFSKQVESAVSQIELNARVRATELPRLDAWLLRKQSTATNKSGLAQPQTLLDLPPQ